MRAHGIIVKYEYMKSLTVIRLQEYSKELGQCILSDFGPVQNYLSIEGILNITVYSDRKTLRR